MLSIAALKEMGNKKKKYVETAAPRDLSLGTELQELPCPELVTKSRDNEPPPKNAAW